MRPKSPAVLPPVDERLETAARRITSKVAVLLAVVDKLEHADAELAEGMREILLDIAGEAFVIGGGDPDDELEPDVDHSPTRRRRTP